jgi:hypothetical protein
VDSPKRGGTVAMLESRLGHVRRLLQDVRTAATMPRIDIVASRGGAIEEEVLRSLRRPHRRYKIVGRKAVGAALLRLDEFRDVEGYLANLRSARKRARRAERLGYSVALFDPNERRPDLLAIHTSMPERQGRPMDPGYLDPHETFRTGREFDYVGVVRDETVVAYCRVLYAGDIASMDRVIGHGDHLANGIMFLLTAGVVEHVKTARSEIGYVYYDTFFGASDGLREFKMRTGFRPHYVHWKREVEPGRRAR